MLLRSIQKMQAEVKEARAAKSAKQTEAMTKAKAKALTPTEEGNEDEGR